MKYDYLIVGSGLFGACVANRLKNMGKKVLVIEKRNHVGGNVYTENIEGINVHKYGAHIFHTDYKDVWDYVNSFVEFNRYTNSPIARIGNEIYNMPFNMNTFSKIWSDVITPEDALRHIEEERREMVENILDGIEIKLGEDYLADKERWNSIAKKVIYTGPIDEFYNYSLGHLEYRSLKFDTKIFNTDNYQGNAVVNYTGTEVPYTRVIEHKHFEFNVGPKTVVTFEYPSDMEDNLEPFYPINDEKNNKMAQEYRNLASIEDKVIFGGRMGEYKYYDMDDVLRKALDLELE